MFRYKRGDRGIEEELQEEGVRFFDYVKGVWGCQETSVNLPAVIL